MSVRSFVGFNILGPQKNMFGILCLTWTNSQNKHRTFEILYLIWFMCRFKLNIAAMKSASPWIPSITKVKGPASLDPALFHLSHSYSGLNSQPQGSQWGCVPWPGISVDGWMKTKTLKGSCVKHAYHLYSRDIYIYTVNTCMITNPHGIHTHRILMIAPTRICILLTPSRYVMYLSN